MEQTEEAELISQQLEVFKLRSERDCSQTDQQKQMLDKETDDEYSLVHTLEQIQNRKQQELLHLQNLVTSLREKRKENLKISNERVARIEASAQKARTQAEEIRNQTEQLQRSNVVLSNRLRSRSPDQLISSPRVQEITPRTSDLIENTDYGFKLSRSETQRIGQPSSDRLYQDTQPRPVKKYEYRSELKTRVDRLMRQIDKDLTSSKY